MSRHKITAKEYMRLEHFIPVYYIELYRRGRKIQTIRKEEFNTWEEIKKSYRVNNRPVTGMGIDALRVQDNFGKLFKLQYWTRFYNITENYAMYKKLRKQLEWEQPYQIEMSTATRTTIIKRKYKIVRIDRFGRIMEIPHEKER